MKPSIPLICIVGLLACGAAVAQTPAQPITAAGNYHPLPKAAYQPSPAATYKVVFSLTKSSDKPDQINPALERVARTVNLYASAGVPLDHLKFVAVAYGPATPLVLDDAHYKAQFGVANPNLAVIAQLRKAGVDVAVCGQAMAEHHYPDEWASKDVTLSLSALTTITELEQQGYALMPL
ncbi:MAG TPA: DsrE family protein [Dyella sp.]|uniref:DsrE family protein n=1 Tax=Dyella sp. TaxID=1869338 RepID=UPI002CDAF5A3|nr:DsrE family protein [Dyella sp.]HUB89033.1 DsrE family protein [Dyella sp.]